LIEHNFFILSIAKFLVVIPVKTGIQTCPCETWNNGIKKWIPAGVYPGESGGRNDNKRETKRDDQSFSWMVATHGYRETTLEMEHTEFLNEENECGKVVR
jgi:hypothetical protein